MEQSGKKYSLSPLISGALAVKVYNEFVCVFLDVVQLRGKTKYTKVYHLLCPRATATASALEIENEFIRFHRLMQEGNTQQAKEHLVQMSMKDELGNYKAAIALS
eukprot:m51a1_g13099 hypothetical protein (105) ;mRNA; r:325-749